MATRCGDAAANGDYVFVATDAVGAGTVRGDDWLKTATEPVPVADDGSLPAEIADLIQDPQLKTNNIIKTPEEDVGTQWVINHPLNIDGLPIQGVKKAPGIGEHTDEILHDLGYRDDEIENLRAEGAV